MRVAFRQLLGLYAPILPFITDELWCRLYAPEESTPSLHVSSWPHPTGVVTDEDAAELVLAVLHAARAERTERRLSQATEIDGLLVDAASVDARARELLADNGPSIRAAARANGILVTEESVPWREAGWCGLRVSIAP